MLVDLAIRKTVCFIGYRSEDQDRVVGTAFFVVFQGATRLIVTAGHVINGIRHVAPGEKVSLWLNHTSEGLQRIETDSDDWLSHPDDPLVDVAVCRTPLPIDGWDHLAITREAFISDQFVQEFMIDVGDELFFPGLFYHHPGQGRVRPIVRQGTIAAMPEEGVRTKLGRIEAYLAEVRSIGGLSGSPVFLFKDLFRVPLGGSEEAAAHYIKKFKDPVPEGFLGLVHGHFDTEDLPTDWLGAQALNMGICVIVPAKHVLQVIDQPEIEQIRHNPHEGLASGDAATLDSVDASAVFAEVAFVPADSAVTDRDDERR